MESERNVGQEEYPAEAPEGGDEEQPSAIGMSEVPEPHPQPNHCEQGRHRNEEARHLLGGPFALQQRRGTILRHQGDDSQELAGGGTQWEVDDRHRRSTAPIAIAASLEQRR